jgi:hypothetical protein
VTYLMWHGQIDVNADRKEQEYDECDLYMLDMNERLSHAVREAKYSAQQNSNSSVSG